MRSSKSDSLAGTPVDVCVTAAELEGGPAPSHNALKPLVDREGMPMIDHPERYTDSGVIGRGGMGAVRALHDATLRREVAAKALFPALAERGSYVQSFVEEAQITAQLDHPNIVPVHELSSDESGSLYFTMKRVRGRTLHALLHDPSLPFGSSKRLAVGLEVILKVCDGLAFAHSRGVLHRDIKPDNIMVGAFGEVYLMDWGLAKVMRGRPGAVDVPRAPGSPLAAAPEGMVGTPAFMAPEVAGREFERVDERTDIFGLGAVIYRLITDCVPYGGDTVEEVLEAAKTCDFTPPDLYDDEFVPRRLARVVAKAMARDPADRHATVEELAGELREFLHRGHHLPRVQYEKGTLIVKEGDPCEHAYMITRGQCEVYRMVGGERHVLRQVGAGAIFGETAILGVAASRLANVVATTDVSMLVLTQEVLSETLAPDTWEGLLAKTLIERFRELDAKLTALERERLLT